MGTFTPVVMLPVCVVVTAVCVPPSPVVTVLVAPPGAAIDVLLAVTGALVGAVATDEVDPLTVPPVVLPTVAEIVVACGKRTGRVCGVVATTVVVCTVGFPITVLCPGVTCVDDELPDPVMVATAGPATRIHHVMIWYFVSVTIQLNPYTSLPYLMPLW